MRNGVHRAAVRCAMWDALKDGADRVLGLSLQSHDLGFGHMAARALVVFCVAVFLARAGDRRMLGHNAGFDIMLMVILGSVLSRGINGQAAFFPTLGVSGVLVLLHDLLSRLALKSDRFSDLVKGRPRMLVRNGNVDEAELRHSKITPQDLDEHLRLAGGVTDPGDVAEARLERNGSISVVKAKSEG